MSVAAEERRAQSLLDVLGLPPPCQSVAANKLKDVQVSPCSGKKAKQKEQSTQKSGGHCRGREEKKKRCRR